MSELVLVSCLLFLCQGAADRASACERMSCWPPPRGAPQGVTVFRGCEVVLIRTNSAPGCRGLDGMPLGDSKVREPGDGASSPTRDTRTSKDPAPPRRARIPARTRLFLGAMKRPKEGPPVPLGGVHAAQAR